MPLSVPTLASAISASLASSGLKGQALPTLSTGVAKGIVRWAKALRVTTADVGTAGTGRGFVPFVLPTPTLVSNMLLAYSSNSHLGTSAPLEATGLARGIASGLAQGMITTSHSSVGTGTGIARIISVPAFPYLMAGLSSVQIKGLAAAQKANAISQALSRTLAVFTLPVAIVGSVSTAPASGTGTGKIV